MSIKLISTHSESTAVNAFKLTGVDAFRYSLKSNGLLSGLISFFLGRKVQLAEAQDNANIPSSIRKTMTTLLKDRNIEPLKPEAKIPNTESLSKEEANVQPSVSTDITQSPKNEAEEAETRYNTYTKLQEDITVARRAKTVWENANKTLLENVHQREEDQRYKERASQLEIEQKLLKEIEKAQKNKEEILSTLSRLMGEKLRDNNPSITDLNNPMRPQKLADKLALVYENEWTDLFLAITDTPETKINDKETCILLLNIFRTLHDEIQSLVALTLQQKANEYGSEDFHSMDISSRDKIRNTIANEYEKNALEIEKKLFNTLKETVLKDLTMTNNILADMNSYIKSCSLLLYFSFILAPPIHFEFKKEGDIINGGELKKFTMLGPVIDYLVWPTIFLNKDGALLSKGVAQPKPLSDEKT